MTRLRLLLSALVVAALVAVVALVAYGRPLAPSAGTGGLPSTFWDYTVTSIVIVVGLTFLALVGLMLAATPDAHRVRPPHSRATRSLVGFFVMLALIYLALRYLDLKRFHLRSQQPQPPVGAVGHGSHEDPSTSGGWFRWDELAIVAGLLLIVGLVVFATRRRGRPAPLRLEAALSAALDESLDDLRSDPDLRRAIVAAYARMERALAAFGVPRRPAEAPLEYLERALLALATSQASVRRLTDLFEWARFSHHEPEESMRDEAIHALEAVRAELRAPVEVAA